MRCLLICGAHPDDEIFFAGTMAKYVSEGVRVCVLCATRGERGNTADLCSIPDLPQLRERELRASMSVLGLKESDIFFLPYEDQKLHLSPIVEVRNQIIRVLRRVKPQVVVTFDPHGANGHSDHVAISRFISDFIPLAADARCCEDAGAPWLVSRLLWQPPHLPWRLPSNTNLAKCFGTDFLIDTKLFAHLKRKAVLEHKTQLPGLEHLFFEQGSPDLTLNQEVFRLAWGPRPAHVPALDLFEALS
jgi:N-acetylglucosamine malate deacetylase 2